jgi:hypothetical protein
VIELHPEILRKDGKPQFAVLPYEEFLQVQQALGRSSGALPPPDPRYGGFFDNLSAAELARRQGVKPAARVEDLYGHGDPADWQGFDEALAQRRAARAEAFDRF